MLTAFMDDSDMCGEGSVGILAGWLAPSFIWADFADDWRDEVLNFGNVPIPVFKPTTRDLKDEFQIARLRAAMGVLERYQPLALLSVVPHAEHKAAFRTVANKRLKSPYYLALCGMVLMLAERLGKSPVEAPIDFVFDHQPGQIRWVHDNWDALLSTTPPEQRRLLQKGIPHFAHDDRVMPLQAAHLLAWNMRRIASDGSLQFHFPWPERIRCFHRVWTEDQLNLLADEVPKGKPLKKRRRQRDGEG